MENIDSTLETGERMPWYDVWIDVTTAPSRDTFRQILADPAASPFRAYLWIGLVSLMFFFLQGLVLQVTGSEVLDQSLPGMTTWVLLCGGIAAPVVAVVGFMISTGILHFIAGLLGGRGSYDDLAFSMGAIQAPLTIFSGLISVITTLFSASGSVSPLLIVMALLSLALGMYALVLQVLAVSVAEKMGTGMAALAVLMPLFLVMVLTGCLVVFALANAPELLGRGL